MFTPIYLYESPQIFSTYLFISFMSFLRSSLNLVPPINMGMWVHFQTEHGNDSSELFSHLQHTSTANIPSWLGICLHDALLIYTRMLIGLIFCCCDFMRTIATSCPEGSVWKHSSTTLDSYMKPLSIVTGWWYQYLIWLLPMELIMLVSRLW